MSSISSLTIVNNPLTIQPGQAIQCDYVAATSGAVGTFENLGASTLPLLSPTVGSATPSGSFYFICVGYSPNGDPKLVADRVIQTNVSSDALSTYGTNGGVMTAFGSNNFKIRLFESAFINDGTYNGEYDQIILDYTLGGLLTTSDPIWNTGITCWTNTTPIDPDTFSTAAAVGDRIARGGAVASNITNLVSTTVSATVGFRPVMIVIPPTYTRGNPGCSLPLVSDISEIEPGQAISCQYTAGTTGAVGTFSNLGVSTAPLLPDLPSNTPNGTFYFVCVGYTPAGYPKLIADRNIQCNIAWDTLEAVGLCASNGFSTTIGSITVNMRIMNTLGERHLSTALYGEWDAIISQYALNGINASDNNTWNCKETLSWTTASLQTVDDLGTLAAANLRIARGLQDIGYTFEAQAKFASTEVQSYVGFRPVIEYTALPGNSRGRVGTTLTLETNPYITKPGQAISCEYTAPTVGVVGTFANLGCATKQNIIDMGENTPNGTFYFVCVGYTPKGCLKFVADRNIQTNISWDTLSAAGLCVTPGIPVEVGSMSGIFMRAPSSLADYMLSSTKYGEWDAIITYSTLGGIINASDSNIWNCALNASWTLNDISTTDGSTLADYTHKIGRGNQNIGYTPGKQAQYLDNYASTSIGFRPVMYCNAPTTNLDGSEIPYRLFLSNDGQSVYGI